MTAALALLRVLADNKPHTVSDLAQASGLTLEQVRNSIDDLRRHNCLRTEVVRYSITERGHAGMKRREKDAAAVSEAAVRKVQSKKAVGLVELAKQCVASSVWDLAASPATIKKSAGRPTPSPAEKAMQRTKEANERVRAEQRATRYGTWPSKWIDSEAGA